MPSLLTLSIVSHGQASLIRSLLEDLSMLPQQNFEVVLTINIPEDESLYRDYGFPLRIIRNLSPKGFGGNHNAAFEQTFTQWFVVVNPDIRVGSFDFQLLLNTFNREKVGAVAPLVISGAGKFEDNARHFPTLFSLAKRFIFNSVSWIMKFNELLTGWIGLLVCLLCSVVKHSEQLVALMIAVFICIWKMLIFAVA